MLDLEKVGVAIGAIGTVAGGIWIWVLKQSKNLAGTKADVAIAESQREVYDQMTARLKALDDNVERLNGRVDHLMEQVRERDSKIHHLEMYVKDLQHTLHAHGIDVPEMRG